MDTTPDEHVSAAPLDSLPDDLPRLPSSEFLPPPTNGQDHPSPDKFLQLPPEVIER